MKRKPLIYLTCVFGTTLLLAAPTSVLAEGVAEADIVTQQIAEIDAGTNNKASTNIVDALENAEVTDGIEKDNEIEQNETSNSSIDEDTITATPTLSPMPTKSPEKWYKRTIKDIIVQLIGAMILFIIPGSIIYYRAKH